MLKNMVKNLQTHSAQPTFGFLTSGLTPIYAWRHKCYRITLMTLYYWKIQNSRYPFHESFQNFRPSTFVLLEQVKSLLLIWLVKLLYSKLVVFETIRDSWLQDGIAHPKHLPLYFYNHQIGMNETFGSWFFLNQGLILPCNSFHIWGCQPGATPIIFENYWLI